MFLLVIQKGPLKEPIKFIQILDLEGFAEGEDDSFTVTVLAVSLLNLIAWED